METASDAAKLISSDVDDLIGYQLRLAQIASYRTFEGSLDRYGIAPRYLGLLAIIAVQILYKSEASTIGFETWQPERIGKANDGLRGASVHDARPLREHADAAPLIIHIRTEAIPSCRCNGRSRLLIVYCGLQILSVEGCYAF